MCREEEVTEEEAASIREEELGVAEETEEDRPTDHEQPGMKRMKRT